MKKQIEKLLAQKIKGNDCTEAESALIKSFLKQSPLLLRIAEHFPAEFVESIDEIKL